MANLIGTAPNQIPTNGHLGGMAYQDEDNVNISGGKIAGVAVGDIAAGAGSVKTVAGKAPDGNGNVVLVASDVGAMSPGQYGWGQTGTASVINDIDSIDTPSGVYGVNGATVTGTVPVGANWSTLQVFGRIISGSGPRIQQMLFKTDQAAPRIWIRNRISAEWGSWVEFYHTGNLAEVPIAERGNDANTVSYLWSPQAVRGAVAQALNFLPAQAALVAGKLSTPRNIAGSPFDGSANINISYNNLTDKPTIPTLPSTVSQAEAEAGAATTVRGWTSQRVRQNVAAYAYDKAYIDTQLGDIETALDTILGV